MKDNNDIMLEFRGYKVIDEGLPYVVNAYEGKDLSSNQFGDNALHSYWVYIFQQTITKYAQKDAELGRAMGRLWPNMEVDELIGSNENTQTFKQLPPQGYKNLGRMLQLVTGKEAAQKLVKGMSNQELREILDAAPESPVLVIPKASNDAQPLDGTRIWVGKKESSDRWSFVNPLEKEKSRATLGFNEFKALAEELAYLKDHSVLKL